MIHTSVILTVAQRRDARNQPIPFSFKAITLDGEDVEGSNCIVTSSYNANRTVNVKFMDSGQFRKFRLISFIEFNGQEVFI